MGISDTVSVLAYCVGDLWSCLLVVYWFFLGYPALLVSSGLNHVNDFDLITLQSRVNEIFTFDFDVFSLLKHYQY